MQQVKDAKKISFFVSARKFILPLEARDLKPQSSGSKWHHNTVKTR